ncbi:thiamine pyrophosphate-binding protein [Crossiella sp. NPDC003009]
MELNSYLYRRLAEAGVARAFGVPGSFVMPIWQTFKGKPDIILSRHETGAVFMADGWSRATGNLGVVLATIGPGLVNCVPGVASAYRDSIPLLVVTGQAPTASLGRGAFLESYSLDRSVAPTELFRPITKASLEIVDAANADFLIDTAISLALSGRRGPVHLSIPIDLQAAALPERAASAPPLAVTSAFRGQAQDGVARLAEELAAAARPLVLLGWGAELAGVGPEVELLARRLDAPVLSSTKAVAAVSPASAHSLGHLGPGQRSDLLPFVTGYDPDLVLILGASLSAFYAAPLAGLLAKARTVRVDVDPDQLFLRHQPDVAVQADLRTLLPELRAALDAVPATREPVVPQRLAEFRARWARAAAAQELPYADTVSMSGVLSRIGEYLPPEAVVVPDAGNHWLDTLSLHRPPVAGGLRLNVGLGAMGWAIGASVGLALSGQVGRTVLVTGDGSMLMHGTELSVAAEHGANLVALVFNNRSHGRVRLGQKLDFDGDLIGTGLPRIDFTQWMSAMGVRSFRISRPEDVDPVLREAFATPGTVGVEIECHPDEVPACLRNWIEDVA